ncbi:Concanavalin A-like lectin/glucanases superfamily [Penicillium cf. griseofulvum]|uniref:Concanavalin A-like lectin/glucanases superfamily n=1 Tax=Penicillium cf. griseofulvum TaxID=2972120 RepID=A0A9W9INP1_9EURO|nr:Concanavalin A-like lectin/glucanases superfamily [Penicillium cf. griseofulvum]KAJ5442858.1 Concanavalin A-like lectin/glucanases superfamily [Penicillium cf. griseofulvum]KAJ5451514.1 Concanavalin A-like lectin/glucanases superfamily [Penicillium cf. griseofulvum]
MKVTATASVLVTIWAGVSAQDYNAPPPNLADLPALSLFETWRPHTHVLPPHGQIGDPCAHYNDPETGLFHVGFLHNGTGISQVLTDDLVHYYDVRPNGNYSIVAGGPNDPLAVFDGSVIPSGVDGKPTLLYTSVSSLPIHWTLPYTRGSESQSLAVTYDGGKNFTKLQIPPVIPEPPVGLDVTAFRDPYVFQNGELDRSLGNPQGVWYTIISGGVRDVGPGMFLYQNTSPDFEQWEYLGEWFHEPVNSTWGNGDWSRIFGFNWETSNVVGLTREGYSYNGEPFMTIAVESSYPPIRESVSSQHAMIWTAGSISTPRGENVTFTPEMVGVFDWGMASYAAAGKVLPRSSQASTASGAPDRFISYVWLTGDVFGGVVGFPAEQQGWQNTLLTSRELYIKAIPNVVNNALVQETGSWRVAANSNSNGKCVELETLGIDIARETYAAMTAAPHFTEPDRTTTRSGVIPFRRSPTSRFFILEAEINFDARASGLQAGFQILASNLESTTIYYQFSNESIMIDRSQTSAAADTTSGIDESPESGRIRLFDINDNCGANGGHNSGHKGGHKGKPFDLASWDAISNYAWGDNDYTSPSNVVGRQHIETLNLTILVDNSVLEVYANSRFVLSTWVRPWYENSTEIHFFQNGQGTASYRNIRVADGLYDAYPDRPQ